MMKVEREVIIKCVEDTNEQYRNIDSSPIEYIVRCKDCKHKYMDGEVTHYYWCRLHDRPVDDTDYCAWGEESEVEEWQGKTSTQET